jgi:penicillin-binding protein 1A
MQAPPRHRPRPKPPSQAPDETIRVPDVRPRRVIPPLVPLVLLLVMAGFAAAVALTLLPIFGAAGAGVNAFRDRLDAAGVGRARIPTLPQSSTIYASDGSVLAEIFLDENRRYVRIGKIADVAQDAVVAIEDDSFYEHGALNFPSLIRAAITNLVAGDIEQGGSTLTQQLVKNVLIDSPEQTFARKFQEAALAVRVERRYTKDEILELYMNEAYYGNGAYGIETAAETYFHTTAKKLTLRQAALLGGIVRAPGAYDPVTHPLAARARRDQVIDKMLELGWIDPVAAPTAKAKPLGIANDVGVFKQKVEPFFVYYIRNLILDNANGEFDALGTRRIQRVHTLYQGGLKIYTSLDPDWQDYAQDAIDNSTYIDPGRNSPDASLVSVRATDGAIKAILSGKNYKRDQYDLVWHGARQVGSAFKPFTLVAAFEHGFPPGKVYSSKSPLCNLAGWISESGCVSNAEGAGDGGYLDLWDATQDSVNVVFAQLALDVGPENIVDAAHRMGITVGLDPVPSITLGVEEVPTMDMASAFATLANDGKHCEPWAVRRIEFASLAQGEGGVPVHDTGKGNGRLLYQHRPECKQVVDPEIAHLVTAMLQRVVCCGTGTAAQIPGRPVAGKTGTAQDYTNVYFAGYTPQVATAVWVGFPDAQRPMDSYYGTSVFGGTVAAPIWQDFMVRAMQGFPVEGFESPPAPESGTVPRVVGLPIEQAEHALAQANFTPIREEIQSFEPAGTVLTQSPGGGARVRLGSAVRLGVSNGRGEAITMPMVVGMTESAAVHALEKRGLVVEIDREVVQDASREGIVIAQSPIGNGAKVVDAGSVVTITVGTLHGGGVGGGPGNGNGNGNDGDGGDPGSGNGNGNGSGGGGGGEDGRTVGSRAPAFARRVS